jgi:uncharacterized membrane protein YciS (DUF1049 family)
MRYQIMDSMLNFGSMFAIGFLLVWLITCVMDLLKVWWRESKQELKVEVITHEEAIQNLKGWRGKP